MSSTRATPFAALFTRVFWMMGGPAIMFLAATQILMNGQGWTTAADLVFGGALAGTILARWAEGRSGHALRADGQPAQPGDLRRYVLGFAGTALVVWVVVNVMGNYLLG